MRLRTDIVVVYVLRPDGRGGHEVLQLRRRAGDYMGGTWQFPGGKIGPGESAPAAAVRELWEEAGLLPDRLTAVSHVESAYVPAWDCVLLRPGFCALLEVDRPIALNDEHDAARWIGRGEIRRLVTWPGERAQLAEIFREHLRPSLATVARTLELGPLVSALRGGNDPSAV